MLGLSSIAPRVLEAVLYSLCVLAVAAAIAPDASASERDYAVGFSRLSTPDPMGGQMTYALWYPTNVPNSTVKAGPFEFPGTEDAEPAVGPFGLVVLSHGSGGSPLGHWDTAVALAKAGFIVAGPLHPRNNVRHDIGDDQRIVLDGRPRQLSAVIDALLSQAAWSSRIDPEKIGAFGFSAGGYTVLAALGAQPLYTRTLDHCARYAGDDPYCRIINGRGHAERVKTYAEPAPPLFDGRLRAAVIADPFAVPFPDQTLEILPPVKLLFYRPEVEDVIKAEFHTSRVVRLLKQRDDFPAPQEVVVPKANHYAFIVPLPQVIAQSAPRIASDPEGFDRAAFHQVMNRTIVAFFKQALAD
ncbi:MAG: hypothetical protein AAF495_17180 [Pseudomonadota bacterium]